LKVEKLKNSALIDYNLTVLGEAKGNPAAKERAIDYTCA